MTIEDGLEELNNTKKPAVKKDAQSKTASAVPELFPVEKTVHAFYSLRFVEEKYLDEDGKDFEIQTSEFNESYADFLDHLILIKGIKNNCAAIHNIAEEWDGRFEGLVSEVAEKNPEITVPSTTITELVDEVGAALNNIKQDSLQVPYKPIQTDNRIVRSIQRINQLFYDIKGTDVLTDLVILNRSMKDNAKKIYDFFKIHWRYETHDDLVKELQKIEDFCDGKEKVKYRCEYGHVKRLKDPDNKQSWIKTILKKK